MPYLDKLFTYMKAQRASDLHLSAGGPPRTRRSGALVPIPEMPVFTDAMLRQVLRELAGEERWLAFESTRDLDFAYGLAGVGRFRANYFLQENGAGAVFRLIPETILSLDELKAPKAIESLAHLGFGLVLVTGPTGSGKSTTLAGIIDRINTVYAKHIITIEDPVEFVHPNKKSTLSQREVGADTGSFAQALRSAIREDADVILVGEMRDPETISLAITAAEMGLLVFGTLHTNNAPKTVDRIIDAFPSDRQRQVRTMLAESLAAVVSQLLVPAVGGGRAAVHEILLRSSGLPNVIREGNTPMLHSLIQQGRREGMQSMDDALFTLAKEGRISARDGQARATHKQRFEPLLAAAGGAAGEEPGGAAAE